MARRLLLLSKHYPPSEEAGALRWQKLTGMAAEHGFALNVASLDERELRKKDLRRLSEIPASTTRIGVPSQATIADRIEAAAASFRGRFARSEPTAETHRPPVVQRATPDSIGVTEARAAWTSVADLRRAYHAWALRHRELAWARAAARALEESADARPAAVVSCGPPHLVHVAGCELAMGLQVPFVMDMRDPWSLVERVPEAHASLHSWSAAKRDERKCIEHASLIVVNTEAHRRALTRLYPKADGRIIAVLNGFDEDDLPARHREVAFTIVYAGTIYLDRDPAVLLAPLAAVVEELSLTPQDIKIRFVGDAAGFGGRTLREIADEMGVGPYVDVVGRVSRHDVMRVLSSADMTIVLPQDSKLAVPSKVYEYLRFSAWLLAFADSDSAVAETLRGVGADVVAATDGESATHVLKARFLQRRAGELPRPLAERAGWLSRREQAARLFSAIEARL